MPPLINTNLKKFLLPILVIVFLILFSSLVFFVFNNKGGSAQRTVEINGQEITVDIADSPGERQQGLSGRPALPENHGMLFIFPNKQVRSFWMPNMNFPLDMIWINDNQVVNITKNAPPGGDNPSERFSSELPVNYVLEVNAGFADRHNIKAGDKVNIKY